MPNWCSNVITLSGEGLEKFRKTLHSKNEEGKMIEFSFRQIVPRPKEEDENWYEWNLRNWGTKWDVNEVDIEDKGDSIIIHNETAWSPPLPWGLRVSRRIPDLEIVIKYREPGVGLCGTYTALNGREKNIDEELVYSSYEGEDDEEDISIEENPQLHAC